MKKKILVVDDDKDFLDSICNILDNDYVCLKAGKDSECFELLKEYPDLILQDVEINSLMDGINIVKKVKEHNPDIPVIMLTKHKDYRIVKDAMIAGALDYITKPPNIIELLNIISRALKETELKEKFNLLKNEVKSIYGELVGESPKMRQIKSQIKKASENNCTVLITGETGTGKELAARLIHDLSERRDKPFVPVNISAIEKEMFLSELFGHEKGSFTGAFETKKGLLETARNGTIFFDEIGDLDLNIQVKLLRILEEKKTKRIGGLKDIEINTRIITATNQDLLNMIRHNLFRKDLFFRLNIFSFKMPSLRENVEDIADIALYLAKRISGKNIEISEAAKDLLKEYNWPGNVRELKNVIEMALMYSADSILDYKDIKSHLIDSLYFKSDDEQNFTDLPFKEAKDEFAKNYIITTLEKYNYKIPLAAKESGIQRPYFYKMMKKYGIEFPEN